MPADWSTHFSSGDIVPPANDGDIHSGDGSVVFQFTGDTKQGDIYQDVSAIEDCCYSLEFWAEGATGAGGMTASLTYLDAGDNVLRTDSLSVHGGSLDSNSFNSYRVVGKPSPSGTTHIRATVFVRGNGKSLRLDDMILTVSGCGAVAS